MEESKWPLAHTVAASSSKACSCLTCKSVKVEVEVELRVKVKLDTLTVALPISCWSLQINNLNKLISLLSISGDFLSVIEARA